jgi:hypothetical protein
MKLNTTKKKRELFKPMKEVKYNFFFDVLKHIFSHKSLVKFGYKLAFIRLLYSIVYPFIFVFKVIKKLFVKDNKK